MNATGMNLLNSTSDENAAASVGATAPIDKYEAVIKVIGVGGCGCNALNLMIDKGVYSAEFIAIDSDAHALESNKAGTRLKIGATEESREADREQITNLLNGANIVFIIAGMGGKTGTEAASLVAQVSRELNILTIAVVSSPSVCEGNRVCFAVDGVSALREYVDTLIVVPIDDLIKIHGVAMPEVFKITHDLFRDAVAGIAEMVNFSGMVAVDFVDVLKIMSEKGSAMMATAVASGPDRARLATERAIDSPLFKNMILSGALGMLVNISSKYWPKLKELEEVMDSAQFAAKVGTVIIGATFDETMGDEMRVTIVATGMGLPEIAYSDRGAANLAGLNEFNAMTGETSWGGKYDIPPFLRK